MAEQVGKNSLEMVFSACENPQETKVDIIAIHGLNTNPNRSFIAFEKENDHDSRKVHWLRDRDMLPAKLDELDPKPPTRIFTYTWNSATFDKASDNYFHQHAEAFLRDIADMHRETKTEGARIIFIASCFGGLVLVKAMLLAMKLERSGYKYIVDQTSGIVFMGTPFRGSDAMKAGQVRVLVARHILGAEASPSLLKVLDKDTGDLQELTDGFVGLAERQQITMFMFYETEKTNIAKDSIGSLSELLKSITELVLVSKDSACLDGSAEKIRLPVKHALLNKFRGPKDNNYMEVSRRITSLVSRAALTHTQDEAYISICNNHYTLKHLEIERLSGELLQMNQCYINLIISETPNEYLNTSNNGGSGARSSPFSLFTRLRVDRTEEKDSVVLSTLFDPRSMQDNQTRRPSRILIQGRAGVGKTTLCKKIVHDFIYDGMWEDLFDRLLWIPLRRLKTGSYNEYNLGSLLYRMYFEQHPDGDHLAKWLWKAIEVSNDRTLFILDGLDEVSEFLDPTNSASTFLKNLLNRRNVIVTTRPHTGAKSYLEGFDLKLETIGFYSKQVDDYLDNIVADPQRVSEIQSFLRTHPLVQSLVQIPIQLDAFCYTWDEGDPSDDSNAAALETMTSVYRSIEVKLWKKDVIRLERRTQQYVQSAHYEEILTSIKNEQALLENLAFSGMYNETLDFEFRTISKFYTSKGTLSIYEILSRLSFLRTSDPSAENRTYHFIHLTFQEYFAAQYFVRQWNKRKPLKYLGPSNRKINKIDPLEFVKRHKYNARYNIVWRFIAGLLDAEVEEGDKGKRRFFEAIEENPRDLLGPTHQRLIMHCFSEVLRKDTPTFRPLQNRLEHQLLQWLRFEIKFTGKSQLVSEDEFPTQVLCEAFQLANSAERLQLLRGVSKRRIMPLDITKIAISKLKGDISRDLQLVTLELIKNSNQRMSNEALIPIVARLDDADRHVRSAAINVLKGQSALSGETVTAIVARLDDADSHVRSAAIHALRDQSALSGETLTAIVARLDDADSDVQSAAIGMLGYQSALSGETLTAIVARLDHADSDVQWAAVDVLQCQAALSRETLTAIVALLDHADSHVQWAAIHALWGKAALSREALTAIVARLDDADSDVRSAAIEVLRGQSALSGETLTAIVARLNDADSDVRADAIDMLGDQSELSGETLTAIVARLDDADSHVRSAAIHALIGQAALSRENLTAIVARLDDADSHVRLGAIGMLGDQSALSGETLTAIVECLDDVDSHIRWTAIYMLGHQSALSGETVTAIVARLDDADSYVRRAAIHVIRGQAALSRETLTAIVARLDDADSHVRSAAIDVLRGQSALPDMLFKQHIQLFYKAFLEASFTKDIPWYNSNETLYISMDQGEVGINGSQDWCMDDILKMRQDLNIP